MRATSYDGKSVTYGSDTEMARAIADLEARIAAQGPGKKTRLTSIYTSKGL